MVYTIKVPHLIKQYFLAKKVKKAKKYLTNDFKRGIIYIIVEKQRHKEPDKLNLIYKLNIN